MDHELGSKSSLGFDVESSPETVSPVYRDPPFFPLILLGPCSKFLAMVASSFLLRKSIKNATMTTPMQAMMVIAMTVSSAVLSPLAVDGVLDVAGTEALASLAWAPAPAPFIAMTV